VEKKVRKIREKIENDWERVAEVWVGFLCVDVF
jgi:hypothetical protein